LAIFSAAIEAFDGARPHRIPAAVGAKPHALGERMVGVRGEPAFDAGGDLPDSLLTDAQLSGDLLLCFACEDVPFIDFAIAP
jgi:hypothetical protein